MSVKYFTLLFICIVSFFLFSVAGVNGATGGQGAIGGIFFVEGVNGVVGWAQNNDGGVINIDLYITKRSDDVSKKLCSSGGIIANKTFSSTFEGYDKIKSKNSRIFTFSDDCIKNLIDGDYDVYLALGPNLFTSEIFQFSVVTDTISNSRLWAHYLGVLINRVSNNYDTYPTIMKDGDKYKMWYASGNLTGHPGDNIFYAESTNAINWTLINGPLEGGAVLTQTFNDCTCGDKQGGNYIDPVCPQEQNFAIDDMHVADPSVIKVNNTYYMYYTAASKKFSCYGSNNHIGFATSLDGINWQKSSTIVTSPVNPCVDYKTCGPWVSGYASWYGAGMPSVIYFDYDEDGVKEFLNFYADTSVMAYSMTLAKASDLNGKNFSIIQGDIVGDNSYDYKYSNYLDKYIAINALPTPSNQPGLLVIGLANKKNRLGSNIDYRMHWDFVNKKTLSPNFQGDVTPRQVAFTMDQFTNDKDHWVINNGALLGNPEGVIDSRNTTMYMGAGKGMQPLEPTWDIIGIDLWVSNSYDFNNNSVVDSLDANYLASEFFNKDSLTRRYTFLSLLELIDIWKR